MKRVKGGVVLAAIAVVLWFGGTVGASDREHVDISNGDVVMSIESGGGGMTIHCVNPGGTGDCFSTIQAAVDASAPGDSIRIEVGRYFENVVIPPQLDGLMVFGVSEALVVIDPDEPNTGPGLVIQSSNVSVSTLTVRNGQDDGIRIDPETSNTTIDDVTVLGPAGDCIDVDGPLTVLNNVDLRGCGFQAVDADAEDLSLIDSNLGLCGRGCVEVSGDRAILTGNSINVADDGECIDIEGNSARIENNTLRGCASDGIDVTGHAASILNNTIIACDVEGIDVFGDDASVRDNEIQGCDSGGISIIGKDPFVLDNLIRDLPGDDGFAVGVKIDCMPCNYAEVTRNSVRNVADDSPGFDLFAADPAALELFSNLAFRCGNSGYELSGFGIWFTENVADENGGDTGEAGVLVFGSGHRMHDNISTDNHGDGFKIGGEDVHGDGNIAARNLEDGFDVIGFDIVLSGNEARANCGLGFEISEEAVMTLIKRNIGRNNRTDFCDEGTDTFEFENDFLTVGPCAIDD